MEESLKTTRDFVKSSQKGVSNFYLIYDNINFPNRVGQQALDSRDRFINATSGAIGILHGEREITKEDIGVKDAMKLKVEDFVSKEDSMHWHTVK